MKILFIILLLLPAFCEAQLEKWDSLKLTKFVDSTGYFPSGVDLTPLQLQITTVKTLMPKDDTVKCLLIVCDTTSKTGFSLSGELSNNLVNQYPFWIYGYIVISYSSSPYYLDERKERLPKNIVVWHIKE